MAQLFEATSIGPARVKNRIAKTATSETRASDAGEVTDSYLEWYEPLVRGGVGLIITGNVYASRDGQSTPKQGGIDRDDRIPGWRRFTDLLRKFDVRSFIQLNHCGRQVMPKSVGATDVVSASDVREMFMRTKPRPLRTDEIRRVVVEFAEGARRAEAAGFDGVQIHAGHGYLISQFLSPYTNRRTDEYGGDLQNRMRFLLETYRETRKRTGAGFAVILKLNAEDRLPFRRGLTLDESLEVGRVLQEEGVDGIELTCGHYSSGNPMIRGKYPLTTMVREGLGRTLPWYFRAAAIAMTPLLNRTYPYTEGFNLPYARQFKEKLKIPILCVGGFQHREAMEQAIGHGECDLVSLGRALVADPGLPRKMEQGGTPTECTFCNECVARAGVHPVDCYDPKVNPVRGLQRASNSVDSTPSA